MSPALFTVRVVLTADASDEATYEALGALEALDPPELDMVDQPGARTVVAAVPAGSGTEAEQQVAAALGAKGIRWARLETSPTRHLDWASVWDGALHAVAFGPLWIVPPGTHAPAHAEHVLAIDAGESFGSGFHPTTALCLDYLVHRGPVEKVLDVGTGSGILALAALTLGTPKAVALDNDPAALEAAAKNAKANKLTRRLEVTGTPLEEVTEQFPLVLANILAAPLLEMAPALVRRVAHGGSLVLSGIRDTQVADISRAYRRVGAKPISQQEEGEWVRMEWASPW